VCCSELQCVAVCCSVLQCVAVCCSVLQCVAVCCSVLPSALPQAQYWDPEIGAVHLRTYIHDTYIYTYIHKYVFWIFFPRQPILTPSAPFYVRFEDPVYIYNTSIHIKQYLCFLTRFSRIISCLSCDTLHNNVTYCNIPQHSATHCDTLQHTATHLVWSETQSLCNTRHHSATHLNSSLILLLQQGELLLQ